jgi:hypothetical protein
MTEPVRALSEKHNCIFSVGAWITNRGGGGRSNVAVTTYDNRFVFTEKKNPCFLEVSSPYVDCLVSMGVVPNSLLTPSVPLGKQLNLKHRPRASKLGPCVPLVCYDVFFPATFPRIRQAKSLFTCSANEEFDTTGLMQEVSLLHAKARSVECGIPFARCSKGGWSYLIDAYGQEVQPKSVKGKLLSFELKAEHFRQRPGRSLSANAIPLICGFIVLASPMVSLLIKQGTGQRKRTLRAILL